MLVMHATFSNCHRYVAQDFLTDIELEEKYGGSSAEMLVFGHYHSTYNFKRGNRHFVNVASVSLPNDGLPLASYGLFTWRRDHWEIEQCRIPYDRDRFIRHYTAWDVPEGKLWQRHLLGMPLV
jgi:predicted phosphodiesterase